jgi:antitoxin component YwqK of YwqJK toxin-antitoxin module
MEKKKEKKKSFYSTGKLEAIENYSNGKLDGIQKYYYKNGQLSLIENYSFKGITAMWFLFFCR